MTTYTLIPRFIQRVLQRHQLPLSSILNFDKMKETLSVNDIVLLASLQESKYWARLLSCNEFGGVAESQFYYGSYLNIYELWYKTANPENSSSLVKILANLVESGQANDEIVERLFSNKKGVNYAAPISQGENPDGMSAVTSRETAQEPAQPYEIIDIGPECYGIIIESGVFPDRELSNKLIKDILKSMYIYMSQSEVAQTQFFKLYLDRL